MPFTELISGNRNWLSPKLYCLLTNLENLIRSKAHRFHPTNHKGVYVVSDPTAKLHICRRRRHNRSKRGIMRGVGKLASDYSLNRLGQVSGGILVDRGANVGELGLWARSSGMNYIAFEPEDLEATCCDLNNFSSYTTVAEGRTTHRLALWHTSTTLEFYSKPASADSSLIQMAAFVSVKKIKAVRLDEMLTAEDLVSRPAVFKVEAEGAEPEVLRGAGELLKCFDYVAVDCGPERGIEKRHTFIETHAILIEAGFMPVAANFHRVTILWRNNRSTHHFEA